MLDKSLADFSCLLLSVIFQLGTDPHINRVVDLTELKRELSIKETMDLILRLASTTTDSSKAIGKEICINVDCFWEAFKTYLKRLQLSGPRFNFDDLMKATDWEWLKLVGILSSATQGKLVKITFKSHTNLWSDYQCVDGMGEVLVQTARLLKSRKNSYFREIEWQVPFPVSLESKGTEKDASAFSLKAATGPPLNYDIESCMELLQGVVKFTEIGLTKLDVDLSDFTDFKSPYEDQEVRAQEDIKELYQEILKSKESLKELRLNFASYTLPEEIFDGLLAKLRNLSSLRLEFDERSPGYRLQAPKKLPSFSLRNFSFKSTIAGVDQSDWLVKFAGNQLESLDIHLCLRSRIPESVISEILNVNSSLKHLALKDLSIVDHSNEASIGILPNLVSLELNNLNLLGYKLVSNYSMPNLLHTTFFISPKRIFLAEEERSAATCHLATILRNSSASLESFKVKGMKEVTPHDREILFPELATVDCHEIGFFLLFL